MLETTTAVQARTRIGRRDLGRGLPAQALPDGRDGHDEEGPAEADDAGPEDDGVLVCLSVLGVVKSSVDDRV